MKHFKKIFTWTVIALSLSLTEYGYANVTKTIYNASSDAIICIARMDNGELSISDATPVGDSASLDVKRGGMFIVGIYITVMVLAILIAKK